ncbi:MAG: hypothetical protein J0L97_05275 [Alphaproteobacteria bacterium]|nr:hypothetical protein [Alphaproteobacteria bacterium]
MKYRYISALFLLSACAGQTWDSGPAHFETDRFKTNRPHQWEVETGEMNGAPACVLTSRRDYLQVTIGRMDGKAFTIVGAGRHLETGTWLIAKFGGEVYRTLNPHFDAAVSQRIIDALKNGETVYVEYVTKAAWSGYDRFTDIVDADNFARAIQQCEGKPRKKKR